MQKTHMRSRVWRGWLLAGAALVLFQVEPGMGLTGPASAQVTVEATFVDKLQPYGRWTTHARYGRVWIPAKIAHDWRPYTVGHWTYSDDYGWYWVSDESWDLTYHYGRWAFDPQSGWLWIPDTVWAASWVVWRSSSDYYGWAPMPPVIDEGGSAGGGFDEGVLTETPVWTFVPVAQIIAPEIIRKLSIARL
jgi:hypothetical protein